MKAVQRLAHLGFPHRGSPGKGNGFLSTLKKLESNGHESNVASDSAEKDVDKNGITEDGVNEESKINGCYDEDLDKANTKMNQITINTESVST